MTDSSKTNPTPLALADALQSGSIPLREADALIRPRALSEKEIPMTAPRSPAPSTCGEVEATARPYPNHAAIRASEGT